MTKAVKQRPPFRAGHIGSLHRPKALRQARVRLLGGLSARGKRTTEDVENVVVEFLVKDRIRWKRSVNVEPFRFLKSITTGVPKVTIPAQAT